MQANPIWPVEHRFSQLERDLNVDIAIVGGGIAGIACGFFLQKAGYSVHVIEKEEVGSAATGASSGILYYGSGTNFVEANRLYGKENAEILWKETGKTINDICDLVEEERIECGLRRTGAIMVAKDEEQTKALDKEKRMLEQIGIKSPLYTTSDLKGFFTAREFAAGIAFDICAQIHPAQFAAGLATRFNVPLFEYTPLEKFEQSGDQITAYTPKAKLQCDRLVVATNLAPFFDLEKQFIPESSVIIASNVLTDKVLGRIWPHEKLIWTMEEQYDIIYPQGGRLVLELYRPKDVQKKLAYYYPDIDFKTRVQWGDSWSKTGDFLPILGEVRSKVYGAVAMGDQGVVMGFTAGRKIKLSLDGKDDPFLALTNPSRFNNREQH